MRALTYMRKEGLSYALDAQNELGQTSLFIVCGRGDKEGILAMMVAGPDPNIRGTFARLSSKNNLCRTRWMTPVSVITQRKRKDLLKSFLTQIKLNAVEKPHLQLKVDKPDSCEGESTRRA